MSDVTERKLLSIAWPVMASVALGVFLPMVDMFYLSRISDQAAAAAGTLAPLLMSIFMIMNTFGQTGASIAAQYLGAGDQDKAQATYALAFVASMVLGALFSLLLWFGGDWIVTWMGLTGEGAGHGRIYIAVLSLGLVLKSLQMAFTAAIASQGRTGWNLVAGVVWNCVDWSANWAFLHGSFGLPRLGTAGVSVSAILAWVALDAFQGFVLWKWLGIRPTLQALQTGWREVRGHMLRIGIPSIAEPLSYQLFIVIVTRLAVTFGAVALSAKVYANQLCLLPIVFSLGLGTASNVLVAHLVGAGEHRNADQRMQQGLLWSIAAVLLVSLPVALAGPHLLSFYTADPDVIKLAAAVLWVDLVLQPAKAANIVLTGAMRAAGDARFPALVGTAMMWTLGLTAAFAFSSWLGLGVIGLWSAMAFDEWTRAIVNWTRWRTGRWRLHAVVRHSDAEVILDSELAAEEGLHT